MAAALKTGNVEPADPHFEYLTVNGIRLRYAVRSGSGTPLLLINGIGANIELVYPFIDAMDREEIIIFDMPGTGRSSLWLRPRRFRGLAKLAAGVLDRLGYREVDVAGVSWGGALAQQFAHQYPTRCRRLILAATSAGAVMVPGSPRTLTRMVTPRRYISSEYMDESAPHIYGGMVRRQPALVSRHTARIIPPQFRGYLYQLAAGLGWTSVFWLRRLRQPTLILGGDDDPLVPIANAKLLATLIPKSQLHVVNGGGHLFMPQRLPEIIPVIRAFRDAD